MDLISKETLDNAMYDYCHSCDVNESQMENYFCDLPSAFEGMTNGEVIEAVWGYSIGINNAVLTVQTDINAVLVIIDIEGVRRELRFSLDWWNAPYQKVVSE